MERKANLKPCVLWVGGDAFVQVINVELKGGISNLTLEITAINKHNSNLEKIEYEVFFYDSSEMKLQTEAYKIIVEDINIEPNSIGIASRNNISKSFPSARRAEVRLLKAYFSNGKSIDLIYENMEKFAITQIDEEDLSILKKVAGEDAFCMPAMLTSNWRCVCGYFNGEESEFCNNCFRHSKQVFNDYSSIEQINEKIQKEIQGQFELLSTHQEEIDKAEKIQKHEKVGLLKRNYIKSDLKEDINDDKKEEKEKVDVKMEVMQFLTHTSKFNLIMHLSSGIMIFSSFFMFILRKA